jgi:hypothetical protein
VKLFTGSFAAASEPGPDQLCVTTTSGFLNCYLFKDGQLSLAWSQKNFILPDEEIIVGDFDGNGADDFLLYRPALGTFRMFTLMSARSSGQAFAPMRAFVPGALGAANLVNVQLRAGQWTAIGGADGLIAYNPTDGRVTLYNTSLDGGKPTFTAAFTADTHPHAPNAETLSTGRVLNGPTDGLALRNNTTGAYRFFDPVASGSELAPATGIVAGQLPVIPARGQLVFARLSQSGTVRNAALFFNLAKGEFSLVGPAQEKGKTELTYWWAFTEAISTRNQGWPPVEHDTWLVLRCKFPDFPDLVEPLFETDTFIQNWLAKPGLGAMLTSSA